MSEREQLRARLFLRSALPLIKVVAADRATYRKLLYKANGTIQFAAKDSQYAAYVELKDGELDVVKGMHPNPTISLTFKTAADLNTFFAGGVALPSIKGLAGIPLLLRVVPFLLKLKILLPDALPTDPSEQELKVKLLLYMITHALSQMNKGGDEEFAKFVKKSPERVYQWTVENGGPAAYLRMKAGKTKAGRGSYKKRRPFVHMIFPDISSAMKVLTQQVALIEAVRDGFVRTEGALEYGRDIGTQMQRMDALLNEGI